MPTNEQRRQAAKRKLERQLVNRASRQKRRRLVTVISSAAAVLLVVGLVYWLATRESTPDTTADPGSSDIPTTEPVAEGETTDGPCKYTTTPAEPAAKPVAVPDDPAETPKTGTVELSFTTNNGPIPVTLDRAKAPCTVQSIAHLAAAKFYDDTPCHRLVASENFSVLQCGDPTGQGNGGPGYTIPDEYPTDLQQAPSGGGASIYPRGVIAMANTGQPNSGGSQFFMVFGSTFLPPNYTVFGTIGEPGLATLDAIGAAGVDPATDTSGRGDGAPALATTITTATVAL